MRIEYDEQFDILEIFLQKPEPALTVELREDVYVHIIPGTQEIIGLTIYHFRSHHPQFSFPFAGVLNPATPTAAADLKKALVLSSSQ